MYLIRGPPGRRAATGATTGSNAERGSTRPHEHSFMSTDQALPAARASERGAATRSGLLAAARAVFIKEGYAQAGVTDIVARAGASVGSLYHHYSGKAELYFALFDELNREQAERTRNGVRQAMDDGVTEPMQLF